MLALAPLILVGLMIIIGCQDSDVRYSNIKKEGWTRQYSERFKRDAALYGIEIKGDFYIEKVYVGDLSKKSMSKKNTVGTCWSRKDTGAPMYVVISRHIKHMSDLYKEAVIYHELSHCVFGQNHRDGESLMNPNVMPMMKYEKNRDYYLAELFGFQTIKEIMKTLEK